MSGICAGRVVIVTGAGRGLGRAHALELAREGARVVVNDLGCDLDGTGGGTGPAGEVVAEIRSAGGKAIVIQADVTKPADICAMVERTTNELGAIDILVNNAGSLVERMKLLELTEERWDDVMNLNLKSVFLLAAVAQ